MAYGDVKLNISPATLDQYWQFISYYGFSARLAGNDSVCNRIVTLHDNLVRYSLCHPWPPKDVETYLPDYIIVKFFADEHADFYLYLGFALASFKDEAIEQYSSFIEKQLSEEIAEHCLAKAQKLER